VRNETRAWLVAEGLTVAKEAQVETAAPVVKRKRKTEAARSQPPSIPTYAEPLRGRDPFVHWVWCDERVLDTVALPTYWS
jgi:hypothetical protein